MTCIASSPSLRLLAAALFVGATATIGCSSSNATGSGGGSSTTTGSGGAGGAGRPADPPVVVDLQGRQYDLIMPNNPDETTPAPLVVMLHGYTDSAAPWTDMDNYMHVSDATKTQGIILALGHGSLDPVLNHYFWNATDACCDLEKTNPNDIGYIMGVIQDISSKHNVDPKRTFVFGHSNGGFMANRVACDQADKIAGIVSLAGETYQDQTKCAASAPIAMLLVQGDADMTVPYAGGHPEGIGVLPIAPGAIETVQDWAKKNRCNAKADTSQPPITLMNGSTGPDTDKLVYDNQCEGNGQTELWTIHGGPHSPDFTSSWAGDVLAFMMAHPKP